MLIGIDARVLERTRTGISRYLMNLLNVWNNTQEDIKFILYFKDKIPTDLQLNENVFETVLLKIPNFINKGLIWENLILPFRCMKDKIDIFFSPHYTLPLIKPANKLAVTIYDISYVAHPEWVPFRNRYIQSFLSYIAAKRANKIITGLQFGKSEISKYFNVKPESINVVYAAAHEKFKPGITTDRINQLKNKYNLKNKVILSIGLVMNRRQQDIIIKSIKTLSQDRKDISFVLIGENRTFPYMDIDKLILDLNLNNVVKYIPYLPEEEIVDIYNLADLYVYISLYEGEGLPLREAMACGLPAVISPIFKEVTGNAGYIVNTPIDANNLATSINKMLDDSTLRQSIIAEGLKRNSLFSWEKCAQETLNVFKSI